MARPTPNGGIRKDYMEGVLPLSWVWNDWFMRQIRSRKGVLGHGNCSGKGTQVKRGLAWVRSLRQQRRQHMGECQAGV